MQKLIGSFGVVHRKNIIFPVFLLAFAFLIAPPLLAAEVIGKKTIKIANIEQYKAQLTHYLQIEKQNNTSPVVFYNLGVIYYKLQQYPKAKAYFHKLLSVDSYHLLAKYNLGLVAYKSGDKKQAILWFKRLSAHSHSFKSSDKLIQLAKIQIAKLNKRGPTSRKILNKSSGIKNYVSAYYGHDDNLIDPDGNVIVGDHFFSVYGSAIPSLDSLAMKDMRWRFSFYSKDYSTISGYDYKVVSTDLGKFFKQNNWRHNLNLKLDSSTYGANGYQSIVQAELKTQYKISSHRLSARYRYYDISSEDPLYDVYAGIRQHVYLRYDTPLKAHKFRVGLSFESNDRADKKSVTGTALSYSAAREKVEFVWFYKFNKKWKSRLKYDYRKSLYNDLSELDNVVRKETLANSSVQIKYRLNKNWWLVSGFRYSENNSNIDRYSYSRNVTKIGISGSF